jgi:hypothetical protein
MAITMREFDSFEKQIIRKLKDHKEAELSINFLLLLETLLVDRGIEIKKSTKDAWIYFDASRFAYYDNAVDAWILKASLLPEVAQTIEHIIKLIFLLDYLETKGLVFLYEFSQNERDTESFPKIEEPFTPLRMPISEKKVVEMLLSFFQKEIVVSQSITTLVTNNFLTRREVQHMETIEYANRSLRTGERSINMANRATGVSIVLGAASVLLSLYSIKQTEFTQKAQHPASQPHTLPEKMKGNDSQKNIILGRQRNKGSE